MQQIRAIIPAAGKGKRLQKISGDLPKAMFAVGRRPMLEYVLEVKTVDGSLAFASNFFSAMILELSFGA